MLLQKLTIILADVMEVTPEEITLQSSQDNLPNWDSLKHLSLMVELEAEFGIELDPEEMAEISSVEKILEMLSLKTAA